MIRGFRIGGSLRSDRFWCYFVLILLVFSSVQADDSNTRDYNPLAREQGIRIRTIELTVQDRDREREIPLRIYLPPQSSPAAVVLFSHGLGGSRDNNVYCGEHWASRGYLVVALQHHGSDSAVWKDAPLSKRKAVLKDAASLKNFLLRVQDVPAVLNQLEAWNRTEGHELFGRLDMKKVGMSGHSFGALTTQAVSGQNYPLKGTSSTETRIIAAIAFSPSSPRRGNPAKAFGTVKIPWMLMTGTKDTSPIGDISVESRLAVFPNLPPGGKYEVVLKDAEHFAFSDRVLPGGESRRNPNHHRSILALSTAFWDVYLRNDAAAKHWLDGTGPRTILEPDDRWQKK